MSVWRRLNSKLQTPNSKIRRRKTLTTSKLSPKLDHAHAPAPSSTMSPKQIGPIAQAWYKWKALRLPWRKRFFIGYDLQGNTYWEFRLTRPSPGTAPSDSRWRRIVHYPRSTHYSQVKVSPLWHQWLRHMRRDPPSLEEQAGDMVRQERMKHLAAEADARWEAKPRLTDHVRPTAWPQEQIPRPAERAKEETAQEEDGAQQGHVQGKEDPWAAKARPQGPGEAWQPTAWNPTVAAPKKR